MKKIGVPESFGSYGEEDTFVMQNCLILKQLGFPVNQHILNNIVIGQLQSDVYGKDFEFNKLVDINLPSKESQAAKARKNLPIEINKNIDKFKAELHEQNKIKK